MNKEVDSGLFNFIFNRVLLINDHVNDEVNDHQRSGWLEFSAIGRKKKHASASNVALATGCDAPGLYGKKS
jgi:hypothetical protein